MAEKIVVSVRVRPLNAKEEAKGAAWDVDSEKHAITPKVGRRVTDHDKTFAFFFFFYDVRLRPSGWERGKREGNKKGKKTEKPTRRKSARTTG